MALARLPTPGPAHKPALQLGDLEAGWPRPLQLGNNQGNAFRIRVRGVRPATATSSSSTATTITTTTTTDDEAASWRAELEGRLGQMKARGFVNYFGSQRLSPHRGWGPDAWEVGRAMLRRDWEAVTRLLLGPREWDSEVGGRFLIVFLKSRDRVPGCADDDVDDVHTHGARPHTHIH